MASQQSAVRELGSAPSTWPMLARAALPAVPVLSRLPGVRRSGSALPQLTLTRHDVPIDRDHVAAYSQVCGFGLQENLPVTYPHVLAFPLHMALMTDGDFPFPVIGLVHVENAITQHRAISASERLQVTVRAENLRAHPKGQAFDVVTEIHSAGEQVWDERSTFLRRGRHEDNGRRTDGGRAFEEVPSSGIRWRLPGDLGRRYASVSGDHNPIHLYGLTAKAFGFPRQIAHGMWSKARCLAALQGRLPDAVTVEVAYKKPILLPGTVAFGSRTVRTAEGWTDYAFSVSSPKNDAPHLLGRTTHA